MNKKKETDKYKDKITFCLKPKIKNDFYKKCKMTESSPSEKLRQLIKEFIKK